jgi:hypothetical protein
VVVGAKNWKSNSSLEISILSCIHYDDDDDNNNNNSNNVKGKAIPVQAVETLRVARG